MGERGPVVAMFPEGAFGPTNNCVAIAAALRRRGARVVFVVEESFAGTLSAQGFEERTMRLGPAPEVPEEPGQFWRDFVRDTAPVLREAPVAQIASFMLPAWRSLVDGARYVEPRLRRIFAELRPDVIVEDNVVAFPAVSGHGAPWVRVVSCNPLEAEDAALPPAYSGEPAGDRSGWGAFRSEYRRVCGGLQAELAAWNGQEGGEPIPTGEAAPDGEAEPEGTMPPFMAESPWLNLTLYPKAVDYRRPTPLAGTWHRMGSTVREVAEEWSPTARPAGDGPLIYVSMGSLGSADPELVGRLLDALGGTRYRVVMSLGPQAAEVAAGRLGLPTNVVEAEHLPQPAILPLVEAVVTHGGNNTFTECLHHGKPMVAMPLFWDQHDNARRVADLDLGHRLDPYRFAPADLTAALDDALADRDRRARLAEIGRGIRAEPGPERAARLILRLAQTREPVTAA